MMETCSCACISQECPNGYYFDNKNCDCRCQPGSCPDGMSFDTEFCDCVCKQPEGEVACKKN